MSNTLVLLSNEMGLRSPSVPEVAASKGDSITFKAGHGAASYLFFDAHTAAALEPSPASPVSLHAGAEVTYTFGATGDGSYGVIVQAPDDAAPETFDFGSPTTPARFVIQPGQGGFPVPTNTTQIPV